MNPSDPNMRILLVAYDYPPLSSPHAIRWYYLSRELVRLGVELHVLTPNLPARGKNCLQVPDGVVMHRCDAGGLAGLLARRQRGRGRGAILNPRPMAAISDRGVAPTTLNWKGRLQRWLERYIGHWVYPDSRGQWRAPAGAVLDGLVDTIRPHILISSHEPAVTLQLGLQVAGRVPAWLVDLGDPVLAVYTPKRWRRRAGELEAAVCHRATAISVTTAATRELLLKRHRMDPDRIFVLSQGFDDALSRVPSPVTSEYPGELRLLYTGRFYSFRDPTALFDAVLAMKQVRLTVAAPNVEPKFLTYAERSAGRITFIGEQAHEEVLELQRGCDVLVNIGNVQSIQTPGKIFEYLGSGKPILHCYYSDDDPVNSLLATWRRGWSCRNDRASLQAFLNGLLQSPQRLSEMAPGDIPAIARYGWSYLARELFDRCMNMTNNAAQCR